MKAALIALSAAMILPSLAEETTKTDLLAQGLDAWTYISKEGEQPVDTAWKLKDGVLSTPGTPAGYIRTKETYQNYTITFEWRWQENPKVNNSGLLVHVSDTKATELWPKSIEAQLLQNAAGDIWAIGETIEAKGENTNMGKRWSRIADPKEKPFGEWNTMTVTCTETTLDISVNGIFVNQGKNLSTNKGAIAFQAEGTPIEIRNVILRQ